jgi:hypothetical protein
MSIPEVKNFVVLCTVPGGVVKEYEWKILLGIIIDRNVKATQIERIFDMGPALLRGEVVDGKDVNMLGYSFIMKGANNAAS